MKAKANGPPFFCVGHPDVIPIDDRSHLGERDLDIFLDFDFAHDSARTERIIIAFLLGIE